MFIYFDNWSFTIAVLSVEEYDLLWRVKSFPLVFVSCNKPTIYSSTRRLLICERYTSFTTAIHLLHRISNMETEMPDLSHLTPEERRVIEGVLMRQRQEEEQERLIVE